jgi:hypothetical protein
VTEENYKKVQENQNVQKCDFRKLEHEFYPVHGGDSYGQVPDR